MVRRHFIHQNRVLSSRCSWTKWSECVLPHLFYLWTILFLKHSVALLYLVSRQVVFLSQKDIFTTTKIFKWVPLIFFPFIINNNNKHSTGNGATYPRRRWRESALRIYRSTWKVSRTTSSEVRRGRACSTEDTTSNQRCKGTQYIYLKSQGVVPVFLNFILLLLRNVHFSYLSCPHKPW